MTNRIALPALLFLLVFGACDGEPDDPDPCKGASADLLFIDANNYQFSGSLDIQAYPVAELLDLQGDPHDITISWVGLTQDLQGHTLDPVADIDMSSLVIFQDLGQEEIEAGLSENSLAMADVSLHVSTDTEGATQTSLSNHTRFGNDIDVEQYFVDGYGTWLFTLNSGFTPGINSRMVAFLVPTPGETATHVELTNDSALIAVDADLTSLVQVPVATGAALSVDWSALTTSAQGLDLNQGEIDQVMIGHYAALTPADLQARFLDLEIIADDTWTLDVTAGTSADLTLASGDAGSFTGVTSEGTWIIALRCTSCANPAPPFMTVLLPCP